MYVLYKVEEKTYKENIYSNKKRRIIQDSKKLIIRKIITETTVI